MGKKALRKDFYMEIKKSLNRFLSILLIVMLGVAFLTGIRSTKPDMQLTGDRLYDKQNLMDIRVIGSLGLTKEDVKALEEVSGVLEVMPAYSKDVYVTVEAEEAQHVIKLISYPETINKPILISGRIPNDATECLVDEKLVERGYEIGNTINISLSSDEDIKDSINETKLTIVGTAKSPYYLSHDRGTSENGMGEIDGFIMVSEGNFVMPVYTEIYLTVQDAKEYTSYTSKYDDCVEEVVNKIKNIADARCQIRYDEIVEEANQKIEDAMAEFEGIPAEMLEEQFSEARKEIDEIKQPEWYVLDRNSLQTYVEYGQDAERIGAIGEVFPIIFFLVAALVSLTTMTRMVEEGRTQIGILKALGYKKIDIASKYVIYALLASVIGSLFGIIIGASLFPLIIINAYKMLYENLPEVVWEIIPSYSIGATLLAVACTTIATILACYKELASNAAELMRPSSPKMGKRVFLEKLPFIWNHLNFTKKSTLRNLIRYKKRFFMTVFGIGGCMALLLVGYGLKDSIGVIVNVQYNEIFQYDVIMKFKNDTEVEAKEDILNQLNQDSRVQDAKMMKEVSVDIGANNIEKSSILVVPQSLESMEEYILLRDRTSHTKYQLNDEGVIISEKLAKLLKVNKGDKIYIKEGESVKYYAKVIDITENYMLHYVYITPNLYEKLYQKEPDYNELIVMIDKEAVDINNGAITDSLTEEFLDMDRIATVSFISTSKAHFENMLENLDIVMLVLIVSAGGLAFIVLYNLNNININERKRELATLKVLGFYDTEVSEYVFRENILLTIFGTVAGIVFGIFLHRFVVLTAEIDLMMFGRDISLKSYIYSSLLTCMFSVAINFSMHFKLKKINMVESLKSIE